MLYYSVNRPLQIQGFYTFFEECYAKDFYFKGEHHNFWEVVYCLDGTTGISADEHIYRLNPGDLVIHRPMVYHKIWSEEGTRAHVLIFSFHAIGTFLQQIQGAFSCDWELQAQWNKLYYRIKESGYAHSCSGFLKWLQQDAALYQTVTNLCENQLLALSAHGLPLGTNQSKNAVDYERIVQIMKRKVYENPTVAQLGMLCGLSTSSMKKLFHQFNSMGIHEYFLHLKMKEAVRLLDMGKTVTETAELLGFSNQSYFSTAFKREMKEIPARFKRSRDHG